MDQSHISARPVSSLFINHQLNPSPFASSSLSTASPYSSFFGSTSQSSKSPNITSFQPHSPSPFGFADFSSFSSSPSPSFYSNHSSISNGSSFSTSSTFSNASPISSSVSNSANCSPSIFNNSGNSTSSSPPSTAAGRMKYWKNRDHLKDSPANQLKTRRYEVVARFRGIDLSDDFEWPEDPGADDPAWSWDAMCNKEWDLSKCSPKDDTPWYVIDPNLSWDQFFEHCERDRIASGRAKPPPQLRNEQMRDPDEETIDEKDIDPWSSKTEIIIEPLININDPDTMLCPFCKSYTLKKSKPSKLQCLQCDRLHEVHSTTTILILKQRMLESLNDHKANCAANFSDFTLGRGGDISLICESCDKSYNISGGLRPL